MLKLAVAKMQAQLTKAGMMWVGENMMAQSHLMTFK